MALTVCWSAKGGSGTTVVAAALALGSATDSLLIDLDGELPAALGVPEPSGQGLSDWFASDAPERAVLDLAAPVAAGTRLVARGPAAIPRESSALAGPPRLPGQLTARGRRRRRMRCASAGVARRSVSPAAGDEGVLPLAAARLPAAAAGRHRAGRGARAQPHRRRCGSRRRRTRRCPDHRRPGDRPGRRRWTARRPVAPRHGQVAADDAGGGMTATSTWIGGDVDERLVAALCRAAQGEPGSAETAVREHVRRLAPLAGEIERERLVDAAVARLDGLGPLDALVRDTTVDEVLVNGGGEIWVERAGELERRGWIGAADLAVVIERILTPLGRRLDRSTPIVDARLGDGTRVCAVVPPISIDGTILSLRRFRNEPLPLTAFGGAAVTDALGELVMQRCNTVISGATSSGKTSLMSSLLGLTRPGERIVLLEDTAELAPLGRPRRPPGSPPGEQRRPPGDRRGATPAHGPTAPTGPSRRRRGPRPRGDRAGPSAEHRARRFVVDVPRQQRPRRHPPRGDARGASRSGVAACGPFATTSCVASTRWSTSSERRAGRVESARSPR